MRIIAIILSFLFLTSCNHKKPVNTLLKSDSLRVDSKYVKGTWISYFQTFKAPLGVTIKFKILNDSSYVIQWGDSLKLKTYPETFHLDGHETWIPRYIAGNKNYIVLRQGCGNPCWRGYFLPLNDSLKLHVINEYLDFDLDNDLVAYINDSDNIGVINLRTNLTEQHILNGCVSAFPGNCIDSLSIKNKTLKYKWFPKTTMNSKVGIIKIEKINI